MASMDLETARLLFDGQRLAHARQFQGLLKAELATEVGVTPAAIGQFESGVARPSTSTLGRLAIALRVPVSYFSQGRRQFVLREDEAHFRSLRSTSKRDRARASSQVERLAEIVAAIEDRVHLPAVDFPEIPPGTSPEDAARIIRVAWGLGDGPIASMVGLLERHGVVVARLASATDEVDAFSCWIGARPFVILASNKGAADRSRFDCGHELAHLLLHPDAKPGDPRVEREAHRFAAELLTPANSIIKEFPRRVDWRVYAALKLRWRVALSMLLLRARDLAVISDAAYRRAMVEMSRRGWRRDEPASLGEPEQPELLGRAMALLIERRQFTLDDLTSELALGAEGLAPYAGLLRPVEQLAV
jgi:Zn-dependent peptidase ImmA (M78 family)/transcriptional regulator with XRE-family HTH domain